MLAAVGCASIPVGLQEDAAEQDLVAEIQRDRAAGREQDRVVGLDLQREVETVVLVEVEVQKILVMEIEKIAVDVGIVELYRSSIGSVRRPETCEFCGASSSHPRSVEGMQAG